jgi:Asp-tRNA(Asn)/Glu-tRNA(Gln) amidotransferase A subunit family amidase
VARQAASSPRDSYERSSAVSASPLHRLSASEAAELIRAGHRSVEDLARSCLERIAGRDAEIRAWAYLDPDRVMAEARELDKTPVKGPLHGIPIGVKDMIDTKDMPTQHNSPIYRGHRPGVDAACITTLRAAGALIFGKTDTVEFASGGRKALTRNPYDRSRTPGGSSSGSAAAVADFHVPLALGTQTGGSTIRPASFCGVFAMKPTWGVVNREGLKVYSVTLDTLGWFGRSVADLALLCDAFGIEDDAPAKPFALSTARIALCRSPAWEEAEPATREALARAASQLRAAGASVVELDLPRSFDRLGEVQTIVMHGEGRAAFWSEYRAHFELLHDDFRAKVENRDGITRAMLRGAYDAAAQCRIEFDAIAAEFDAILTPSAVGEAPVGLASTGAATFNRIWTLLHVPCVNIPGATGPNGLPVGVTLTGPRFTDRRLLVVAEAAAPAIGGGRSIAADA